MKTWKPSEVEQVLAHHLRIGNKIAVGASEWEIWDIHRRENDITFSLKHKSGRGDKTRTLTTKRSYELPKVCEQVPGEGIIKEMR